MSYALDVNVLLYATDASANEYEKARAFLDSCIRGPDLFYLGWPTVMGYLRISTHPSVFTRPLSPEEAERNIRGLMALPHVRLLSEGEGFWEIYQSVVAEVPVRGNLVSDAHLAALLRQHGVRTIYTRDTDFRRFSFLRVVDPLS